MRPLSLLLILLCVPALAQDVVVPAEVPVVVAEPIPAAVVCPPCDCSEELPSPAVKTALDAIERFEQLEKMETSTLITPVPATPVIESLPAAPKIGPTE